MHAPIGISSGDTGKAIERLYALMGEGVDFTSGDVAEKNKRYLRGLDVLLALDVARGVMSRDEYRRILGEYTKRYYQPTTGFSSSGRGKGLTLVPEDALYHKAIMIEPQEKLRSILASSIESIQTQDKQRVAGWNKYEEWRRKTEPYLNSRRVRLTSKEMAWARAKVGKAYLTLEDKEWAAAQLGKPFLANAQIEDIKSKAGTWASQGVESKFLPFATEVEQYQADIQDLAGQFAKQHPEWADQLPARRAQTLERTLEGQFGIQAPTDDMRAQAWEQGRKMALGAIARQSPDRAWIKAWELAHKPNPYEREWGERDEAEAALARSRGELGKFSALAERYPAGDDTGRYGTLARTVERARDLAEESVGFWEEEVGGLEGGYRRPEKPYTPPPTPAFLAEMVPGLVAGQPIHKGANVRIPSPQSLGRRSPAQLQQWAGYLDWRGISVEDILSEMQRRLPVTPREARGTRWAPARQRR